MQNQASSWQEKVTFAYIDEPPFAAPTAEGRAVGADVELATIILQRLGVRQVETRLVTFADLLPGIVAGRWTMNTAMFITPGRSELVAFSRPIWALADGLILYGKAV